MKAADLAIMAIYFGAMLGIGIFFSRRNKATSGYFLGGNRLPSWAIGLSMLATSISSVTFLAMPGAAFALDWRMLVPNLTFPIIALIACWLFVPFFRLNAKMSAFEYLETRFGKPARLYASGVFLLTQSIRMGSILYLLSIPIEMFTGIPAIWIMLFVGGLTALYTMMGGLEAVVWTDVVQAVILYVGGAAAIAVIIFDTPGGMPAVISTAIEHDKFSLGPMHWDTSDRTFWTMLIVGITGWLTAYAADQNMVQRYLAARTTREAREATLLCAFLSLPTWIFFFFIGTCLYAHYIITPSPDVVGMPADNVFPHFIIEKMPAGLSGLVIAGAVSAAMSSISSSLNSFATVSTVDFIRPHLLPGRSDAFYSKTARVATAVAAFLMFGVGIWILNADKESFVDLSARITGMIGEVVVAFFMLGFFAPSVNRRILWQAFAAAMVLNAYLVSIQFGWIEPLLGWSVHPYWIKSFVALTMIALAFVLSKIQRCQPVNLEGLTMFTPAPKPPEAPVIKAE